MTTPEQQMQACAARINSLVEFFGAAHDPEARNNAQELVQLLMEMYGAGLERIVRTIERSDAADEITEGLLRDELISSLLVLHDLHPENSGARIARGLDRVRELTGADIELVDVSEAAAHVRVRSGRSARTPPRADLRRLIEEIVEASAPEITRVDVEHLDDASPQLVQLTRAPSRGART